MNRFHRGFYAFMRTVIKPYFRLNGYSWEPYEPKSGNYLVLTNHNTNWDFFLYGLVLKRHMYFVASEHIFRKGFTSKLIRFLADPIPRKKGADGDDTVKLILSRLKAGENVCMMAEGNRSFSGETCFISPRTAAVVKESGVGLITLAIHGCYFINPRWSKEKRRGPSSGSVVREYTAAEIAEMTEEEVYEAIKTDLWVDAYADQRKSPARYTCKRPAERLESALFLCPECGSMSSMSSCADEFFCRSCGYRVRYNDYGFFEPAEKGGKLYYDTVAGWYHAQLDKMRAELPGLKDDENPLFSDNNINLASVTPGKGTELLVSGEMIMFPGRLVFKGEGTEKTFRLEDIAKISITQTDVMLFTASDGYYEVRPSEGTFSALKYMIASRFLIGKEYY